MVGQIAALSLVGSCVVGLDNKMLQLWQKYIVNHGEQEFHVPRRHVAAIHVSSINVISSVPSTSILSRIM